MFKETAIEEMKLDIAESGSNWVGKLARDLDATEKSENEMRWKLLRLTGS